MVVSADGNNGGEAMRRGRFAIWYTMSILIRTPKRTPPLAAPTMIPILLDVAAAASWGLLEGVFVTDWVPVCEREGIRVRLPVKLGVLDPDAVMVLEGEEPAAGVNEAPARERVAETERPAAPERVAVAEIEAPGRERVAETEPARRERVGVSVAETEAPGRERVAVAEIEPARRERVGVSVAEIEPARRE